jgi:hypothetical protein
LSTVAARWNFFAGRALSETTNEAEMIALSSRRVTALALAGALALASVTAAQARDRRGHYDHRHRGGGGGGAAAAIIGGLIGLGVGAAISNQGYAPPGYYAPPPAYYGPPPGYYAPPPAVYYGY